MLAVYVDSFYLVTSTISTVGFGDFKGFNDKDGGWFTEMLFLYCVMVLGITLFASVTNEIFSYKKLLTVHEIVKNRVKDIEIFMYEVKKLRKTEIFDKEMI